MTLFATILAEARALNANVLADGEAVLSALPGKVITIFPLAGTGFTVVNLIVCMAVIGTVSASPEWNPLAGPATKYTVRAPPETADCEAIVTVRSVSPVSGRKVAESEAKNWEPLSVTLTWVALAAILAAIGADAEGREVLKVSLMELSVAAYALSILTCVIRSMRIKMMLR